MLSSLTTTAARPAELVRSEQRAAHGRLPVPIPTLSLCDEVRTLIADIDLSLPKARRSMADAALLIGLTRERAGSTNAERVGAGVGNV